MQIKTANGWRPLLCPCTNSNQLEGVFNPVPHAVAIADNDRRADLYAADVDAYINGNLRKERIFGSFGIPRHGAFGEKL